MAGLCQPLLASPKASWRRFARRDYKREAAAPSLPIRLLRLLPYQHHRPRSLINVVLAAIQTLIRPAACRPNHSDDGL